MANLYYDPGKYGLTPIGEIDWSDGCYEFDLTVVYRRMDGTLVYAEDSGCSCPEPFEGTGIKDLAMCKPAELQAHLESRNHGNYAGDRSAEIADLMAKVTR